LYSKEYKKRLRQKYVGIVGKPKWAEVSAEDSKKVSPDDNEDFDLLKVNIIKI